MLKIMKASAGSGKTYNLAKTYISLLIKNPDRYAYRHILAVTFTNKATEEMKSRILKELHILAQRPAQSDYLADLMAENGITQEEVSRKAQNVLYDILHDYSAFAVSTIDKFFQQTLKAFSREIGQFASYQVEIDRNSLIAESVDRVLDSLTEDNGELLPWLTSNVIEQIEQGERYNLETNLMAKATRLKSPQRQEAIEKMGKDAVDISSKGRLKEVRDACRDILESFNTRLGAWAEEAVAIMTKADIGLEQSNRGFMKHLLKYQNLSRYALAEPPSDSFMEKAIEPDLWFARSKAKDYLPLVITDLRSPLQNICELWKKESKVYNTAAVIDEQIYGLGIAAELEAAFSELMKEKNVLCIDDSNTILRDIIDGSDAPFVYEKLGVRFEHFLLDEFQDTSSIQWENFRSLIQNSDSQGHDNLIVGDVKQSIYRWRGSDWQLLNSTIPTEFDRHEQTSLQTNYRSLSTIVEFNNVFFKVAARILDKISGHEKAVGPIGRIYADVRQNVAPSKKGEGSVSMTFCSADDELRQVYLAVIKAVEAGAKLSEIAVLVRSNSSGEAVASYLIDNGIAVITEEALKAKSALTVRRLVSLLSYVDNPDNTVNSYLAKSLDVELPDSCLSLIDMAESLLRSLKKADTSGAWKGEALHVQTFMDCLLDYVSSNGNNLRGFLKYWDTHDPSVCSSPTGDSVRVMTIHKSKGLDFPYVILPFAENLTLYKSNQHWCVPDLAGTQLEEHAVGVYDVNLSSSAANTCFSEYYVQERFLQQVDNINTLYVAMTRPALGMHIIAKTPPASQVKAFSNMVLTGFTDFSQILYWFAERTRMARMEEEGAVSFFKGTMPDFNKLRKDKSNEILTLAIKDGEEYPSIPLNFSDEDSQVDVCERGRMKFISEALDFFKEDQNAAASSKRVRGVVLHAILSEVVLPEDLEDAVSAAVIKGEITSQEAGQVLDLLTDAVRQGQARGWFPSDRECVMNEVAVIDVGGGEFRPDRVVMNNGQVIIVDYKFGEPLRRYESQVRRYAGLWEKMGYADVKAFLWYVDSGHVVEVL